MEQRLNNAQLEILKLFAKPLSKKDLADLRKVLIQFLSKKIDDEVENICNEKKINQKKLDDILNAPIPRKK